MDWRSSGRQSASGTPFRGMGTRGRGRGRGRGGSNSNNRPSATAPPSAVAATPVSTPSAAGPSAPANIIPKTPSRKGPPQKPASINGLNTPKPTSFNERPEPSANTPAISRRTSHNTTSSHVDPAPSSTTNTPRPKASRKRSHNRNRSGSKSVANQVQSSAPPALRSLNEKQTISPPVLKSLPGTSAGTDIDALVERVRAMAIAGSAIEREKDKDKSKPEPLTLGNGHLDWAGDLDDSLPDLDDWMKPKASEEVKIAEESTVVNDFTVAEDSIAEESTLTEESQVIEEIVTGINEPLMCATEEDIFLPAVEPTGDDAAVESVDFKLAAGTEEVMGTIQTTEGDTTPVVEQLSAPTGKAKARGRQGRKRTTGQQEWNTLSSGAHDHPGSFQQSNGQSVMMHPLPAKPEILFPSLNPFYQSPGKPEGIRTSLLERIRGGAGLQAASSPPGFMVPTMDSSFENTDINANQRIKEEAIVVESNEPSSSTDALAKDSSIDHENTPISRSELVGMDNAASILGNDSVPSVAQNADGWFEASPSDPFVAHSTRHNEDPLSTVHERSPPSSAHFTPRSQMNSPRKPRYDGVHSHQRARSTPQARIHASRPIISVDALSRLSRTLGATSANTSPHKPHIELTGVDQAKES
ncbi:hypothetical protein M422DRAFT_773417 [Sphaerobolus stellatus SS14]|nr:hypothetical protein M422DRAFT_773417 [Sphaerobolus stellatus SS14]